MNDQWLFGMIHTRPDLSKKLKPYLRRGLQMQNESPSPLRSAELRSRPSFILVCSISLLVMNRWCCLQEICKQCMQPQLMKWFLMLYRCICLLTWNSDSYKERANHSSLSESGWESRLLAKPIKLCVLDSLISSGNSTKYPSAFAWWYTPTKTTNKGYQRQGDVGRRNWPQRLRKKNAWGTTCRREIHTGHEVASWAHWLAARRSTDQAFGSQVLQVRSSLAKHGTRSELQHSWEASWTCLDQVDG